MGKTVRKYRKNRDYDYVPPAEKVSPYDIHDNKGPRHVDNDLLASPREFVTLDQLAPGHASSVRIVLTLMATSVGATAVVVPHAMRQGGFGMTICMVVIVFFATHLARTRLVELGVEHGFYTFHGLAKLAFGPVGGFAVHATQLSVSLGLIIAYLCIVFQDIPIVLGHWLKMDFDSDGRPIILPGTHDASFGSLLADRHWLPEAITLFVLVPYCLYANTYKRMRLAPAAVVVALVAAAFGAIATAKSSHDANVAAHSQGYDRDYLTVPASTVCQAFAVLTTVILNQHHSFHAFYAMRDRSTNTFRRLSLFATLGSLLVALGVGIGGYVSFLGATKSDVVHNYDFATNRGLLGLWTALPFTAVACVGFEVIVSRHTLQFLFRSRAHVTEEKQDVLFAAQHAADRSGGGANDHLEYESPRSSNFFTAWAIILTAQVPIFVVSDISSVLAITGALAGISLCFILPAACQLKLAPSPSRWRWNHVVPWTSIVIGVATAVAAVISAATQTQQRTSTPGDPSS